MSKKRSAAPDLDDLLAQEKCISKSNTPMASPVQKLVAKRPCVEQSDDSEDDTQPSASNAPDVIFNGTFGSQPMPKLKLSDSQNRPLLQTLSNSNAEGAGLLLCSNCLYEDLLSHGCPADVSKWLFAVMAGSGDELVATAAFKTLRGLMTGDEIPPGCTLATPLRKKATLGTLEWTPNLSSFEGVLHEYGADTEGCGMPSVCNLRLLLELMACAVFTQPKIFSADDICKMAELGARAFLDPLCVTMAITFQSLFIALVKWADSPQAWSSHVSKLAQSITSEKVTLKPARLVSIAEALPPTPRARRLQRVLGLRILQQLLQPEQIVSTPSQQAEAADIEPAGIELSDLIKLLKNFRAAAHFDSMQVIASAAGLCLDYVGLLEAETTNAREVCKLLEKMPSSLSKSMGSHFERMEIKSTFAQLHTKLISLSPGINKSDSLC